MFITESEKLILKKYFSDIQKYIAKEYIPLLPKCKYPNGSKITRGKIDESGEYGRNLIIPQENAKNIIIPLIVLFESDDMQHSATIINSKIYFHQNATDSKDLWHKNSRDNLSTFFDMSDKKTTDHSASTLTKSGGIDLKDNLSSPQKVNYYKYDLQINLDSYDKIKTVVKTASDLQGARYCLVSKTSNDLKFLPINAEVRKKVGFFTSDAVISRMDANNKLYKTLDIVPYKGKTLWEYIDKKEVDKSLLAEQLIQAYLEQVADKNLVHTDINPNNICIDENMVITYIDFENSYILGEQISNGLGTPGYLAYEFFNKSEDCDRQLEIRERGQQAFVAVLKQNYRELFSPATDIFALGKVLIQDLELTTADKYYDLAVQMLNQENDRLGLESLRDFFQRVSSNIVTIPQIMTP